MHVATSSLAVADGLSSLPAASLALLVVAVGLALAFEFVNGFHDTANAVATVIYTHALQPWVAVVWSGLCNLTGVLWSNGLVAYTVVALLPAELVLHVGSGAGFAMIFALLLSAILWNLGTWYLGLPASSTHTLVGSILGVGLANALLSGHPWVEGVNWHEVRKVFLSLLVSPVIGFVAAGLLLLALKLVVRSPALFQPPPKDVPPPWWIRSILVCTCTGVSFFHGTNDGQKGMGLLLLILIAVLPAEYALNLHAGADQLRRLERTSARVQPMLDARAAAAAAAADPAAQQAVATERPAVAGKVQAAMAQDASRDAGTTSAESVELTQYLQAGGALTAKTFASVAVINRDLVALIHGRQSLADVPVADRQRLRTDLYLVDQALAKLTATGQVTDAPATAALAEYHAQLDATTQYIPTWVKVATALALGCGTMVGWKRIVTTVGERIGKQHLTYAEGMSAELVAMFTIKGFDRLGLPVSTTHVLSSGVAGTMTANHSGLQMSTLRNILMAWVLTLPVCVLLGAMLFAAGLLVVLSHLAAAITAALVALALATAAWRFARLRLRRAPAPPAFRMATAGS